ATFSARAAAPAAISIAAAQSTLPVIFISSVSLPPDAALVRRGRSIMPQAGPAVAANFIAATTEQSSCSKRRIQPDTAELTATNFVATIDPCRAGAAREAELRVVDAIAQWFEVAGFKHYFGYAGGAIWPLLDGLSAKPEIEGIQSKHESHAVHMA